MFLYWYQPPRPYQRGVQEYMTVSTVGIRSGRSSSPSWTLELFDYMMAQGAHQYPIVGSARTRGERASNRPQTSDPVVASAPG